MVDNEEGSLHFYKDLACFVAYLILILTYGSKIWPGNQKPETHCKMSNSNVITVDYDNINANTLESMKTTHFNSVASQIQNSQVNPVVYPQNVP